MTLTGKSVTSDEGQEEVPLFVEPEPMPFGLSDTARILGCMMINIPFHLIGTKIASYPLLSREIPSRLPRGLDVLQRTSGPLIGASAFCWVVMYGTVHSIANCRDLFLFAGKKEITEQDVNEVTKPLIGPITKFDFWNYTIASVFTSIAFPFVCFIPIYIMSNRPWKGKAELWEHMWACLYRHYPTVLGLNLIRMLDNPLRSWLEEASYNLLGRPFDKQEDDAEELRRGITPRLKGYDDCDGDEDDEDDDDEGGSVRRRVVWNKAIRLGISVAVAGVTAALWLPLDVVTAQVTERPLAYDSPIQCAKEILAVEGWRGLYRGAPFFFLGLLPYDTLLAILGE